MKAGRIAVAVVVVMIMAFSTLPTYALPTKDTVRQPGKVSSNRAFYGIDVSVWQGNIDWQKVKHAGAD